RSEQRGITRAGSAAGGDATQARRSAGRRNHRGAEESSLSSSTASPGLSFAFSKAIWPALHEASGLLSAALLPLRPESRSDSRCSFLFRKRGGRKVRAP